MGIDIALGLAKIIGGIFTQSFALIADGIHPLTDAATDILVIVVARVANAEADAEQPYGHGRFETLGTIAMGMVFFAIAGILLYEATKRLLVLESLPTPAIGGIALALLSVAAKEWIFHYTMRTAKKLNSSLLKANAWHSRSDAFSSIAVLIGLLAAQQGYPWMDTVAAMLVALIIARIGWELCADSLRELVDTAVPKEREHQIEACILNIEGIRGITKLRSRFSGGKLILEIRLLVDPRVTVSEGHQLGETASLAVRGSCSDVADVIVHIDPFTHAADKEAPHPDCELPDRVSVLKFIRLQWQDLLSDDDIENMDLHYLEHGIEIELTLAQTEIPPRLLLEMEEAVRSLGYIAGVRIYRKLYESPRPHPES